MAYFYYNEDGVRLQKTATGTTGVTKYSLHGKNIVHMTNGSNQQLRFYRIDFQTMHSGYSYALFFTPTDLLMKDTLRFV